MSNNKWVIIVAGGSGSRMGSEIPKQFIKLGGLPILMHTITKFYCFDNQINIITVLPKYQIETWLKLVAQHKFTISHHIVEGGKSRFDSVKNGLNFINSKGLVAIHDGVRPFVSNETIMNSFEIAKEKGNAVAAVNSKDSIRIIEKGGNRSLERDKCQLIQTPQTFDITLIKKAFEEAEGDHFTDDASVVENIGVKINLIAGTYQNIKITTPEDLIFANAMIEVSS